MKKAVEQGVSSNCSKCKSIQVKTDLLNVAKIAVTLIPLGLRATIGTKKVKNIKIHREN